MLDKESGKAMACDQPDVSANREALLVIPAFKPFTNINVHDESMLDGKALCTSPCLSGCMGLALCMLTQNSITCHG